jgi:hypothetical protein
MKNFIALLFVFTEAMAPIVGQNDKPTISLTESVTGFFYWAVTFLDGIFK